MTRTFAMLNLIRDYFTISFYHLFMVYILRISYASTVKGEF